MSSWICCKNLVEKSATKWFSKTRTSVRCNSYYNKTSKSNLILSLNADRIKPQNIKKLTTRIKPHNPNSANWSSLLTPKPWFHKMALITMIKNWHSPILEWTTRQSKHKAQKIQVSASKLNCMSSIQKDIFDLLFHQKGFLNNFREDQFSNLYGYLKSAPA